MLTATLPLIYLLSTPAFLFRKMKDALTTRTATSAQLGLKLFGHLDCSDGQADVSCLAKLHEVFVPDEAQCLAIQRALFSEILLILLNVGK